ncbi:hypothetical protein predicted by Glimmer/Critica [Acetobacter ghanensis]|uniref:Uncharacterized protein n=1 Tax=Acetobacter ghanensis TaxID=431306 RepID=A0A0U5F7Y0_9PROT|nr:hypothetical protein predicted by Glimmer/Critica [Acetobacter ghanensis]
MAIPQMEISASIGHFYTADGKEKPPHLMARRGGWKAPEKWLR